MCYFDLSISCKWGQQLHSSLAGVFGLRSSPMCEPVDRHILSWCLIMTSLQMLRFPLWDMLKLATNLSQFVSKPCMGLSSRLSQRGLHAFVLDWMLVLVFRPIVGCLISNSEVFLSCSLNGQTKDFWLCDIQSPRCLFAFNESCACQMF